MPMITVKCPGCYGKGSTADTGHFSDYCEECSGTGSKLISVDEANAILTQKQINDAGL